MKIITILAVSCAALLAAADVPYSKMSKDAVEAADRGSWGTYMIGGKWLELIGENRRRVDALKSCVSDVNTTEALKKPEKSGYIETLWSASGKNLRSSALPAMNAEDMENSDRKTGFKVVEGYWTMCSQIDRSSRPRLYDALDALAGRRIVERHARWKKAVSTLEHLNFRTEFKGFDEAYGEWNAALEKMKKNRVDDIAGTELMMGTKLYRYADASCRKQPYLDSDSRVVDNLLVPLREEERKAFADGCAVFGGQVEKLAAAVANDRRIYEFTALEIHPDHRRDFERLFNELETFVKFAKELLEDSEKMLAAAVDQSSVIGELRFNKGFSPNGAFECAGPTQSNGCPGYSRRIRVALEDCKARYLKTMREITGRDANWQ